MSICTTVHLNFSHCDLFALQCLNTKYNFMCMPVQLYIYFFFFGLYIQEIYFKMSPKCLFALLWSCTTVIVTYLNQCFKLLFYFAVR